MDEIVILRQRLSYVKAAYELSKVALERIANAEIGDHNRYRYIKDTLEQSEKWYNKKAN